MGYKKEFNTAYFASGCFWGTQYHFDKLEGVEATYVGYMGGNVENPTYEQVKTGETGHVETVMVIYDPNVVSYLKIMHLYFETHNFEQADGQGPDIGSQYRSKIFYSNDKQLEVANRSIELLSEMGYAVATILEPATVFWIAEDYHQQYYEKTGGTPYCHIYRKLF